MSHNLLQALVQSQQARPNLEQAIYEYFSQFVDEKGTIEHEVNLTVGAQLTAHDGDGQDYLYVRAMSAGVVDCPYHVDDESWDTGREQFTTYKEASTATLEFIAQKILHLL